MLETVATRAKPVKVIWESFMVEEICTRTVTIDYDGLSSHICRTFWLLNVVVGDEQPAKS